jgi:ketosteroid isomerase-like protein
MSAEKQQIIDQEKRFWTSMKDKDVATAQSMIHKDCLITGPMGTMRVGPEKYAEMTREGQWRLDSFELTDVDVTFPTNDVAVIAYKVHQKGEMKGKPMDLNAADSTTWVRDGDSWKVALHTESTLQTDKQLESA